MPESSRNLELETHLELSQEMADSPNLCDRFSSRDLQTIGKHIWEGYQRDKISRMTWERRMNSAMDLAMQVSRPKNFPWPGCSNVVFPLVTISALQFSAESYPNIIQGTNVVRYRVTGKDIGDVRARAQRIGRHMSWQVLEQDEAWEEQHDRLLINLAIVGCNFIKSWYNASKGYPVDELVMARDLVIDYGAKSLDSAQRITHVIPLSRNEIYERVKGGRFRDILEEPWFLNPIQAPLNPPQVDLRSGLVPPPVDDASKLVMLEQHCFLDLDGDGYSEPYIATIEHNSQQLVRLVARFEGMRAVEYTHEGDVLRIEPLQYFTKFSFIPSPDGSIYDLGFGIFLGPINEAVNSGINQLLDNGTMQNSLGGFLGRGAKIRGGVYTMAPWEWKRVDSTGDDLRKSLVPYPERQPSAVMFQLIALLIDYANRIAGTTDPMVGENPGQNTPAGTYQGMTERGMRMYRMIFKRVWRSMKEEFKKRYILNRQFLRSHMDFGDGDDFIRKEDYTGNPNSVAPVANPNITSTTMRLQQAIAVKQDSVMTPGYNIPEVTRSYLEALDVDGIERLYPGPDKVPPLPNPRVQAEQMKLQGRQLDIQNRRQEWANRLMEERRVNAAKIAHLEAQAFKLMKEAGAADAAAKLKEFDIQIKAMIEFGKMLNERIQAMTQTGATDEPSSETAQGRGVPGMAEPPGNAGATGVPAALAEGPPGPMGGGGV